MDGTNTATLALKELNYKYEPVIMNEYAAVFLLADQKILICELLKEYVPIEQFIGVFSEMVPIILQHQIKKFIFDKQNLRVFHQPSMEWYFLYWKKEILEMGLSVHRKILPQNQPAFNLAVQAGLAKIKREHKDTIIHLLDIKYSPTVKDAIEH
jgi:hypothetical protein